MTWIYSNSTGFLFEALKSDDSVRPELSALSAPLNLDLVLLLLFPSDPPNTERCGPRRA